MKIGYRVCYLILILLLFGCEKESSRFGRFIDKRDGKIYRTVKIGEQVWMAENLAYRADTGCLAYEEDESNMKIYGYLYNWETACEVCPEGWILPSDDDWKILEEFIGMSSEELDLQGPTYRGEGLAGLLKVVGHSDWEKIMKMPLIPQVFLHYQQGRFITPILGIICFLEKGNGQYGGHQQIHIIMDIIPE
jgi:hypothetical protein